MAAAQQSGRVYRVGLLSISSAAATAPARAALLAPLAELGYREGRNLTLEERYADGDTAGSTVWPPISCGPGWKSSWR